MTYQSEQLWIMLPNKVIHKQWSTFRDCCSSLRAQEKPFLGSSAKASKRDDTNVKTERSRYWTADEM